MKLGWPVREDIVGVRGYKIEGVYYISLYTRMNMLKNKGFFLNNKAFLCPFFQNTWTGPLKGEGGTRGHLRLL